MMMDNCSKTMTIKECSQLYKIGVNRLRQICKSDFCPFVLKIGTRKKLIKTKEFEKWLSECECI